MKAIEEFLSDLRRRDVKLWAEGVSGAPPQETRLRCKAPSERLTPTLLQELKERKAQILTFLHNANAAASSNLPPIRPIPQEGNLTLSFAQQRLWFLDQLEPGITYNMPTAYRLTGSLNITALEQSFSEIIRRHEALRTTFPSVDGQPSQVIAPSIALTLPIIDLGEPPETKREAIAQQIATEEAQQPFDLATGPLFRAKLLRLTEAKHMLLLNMHHIISDGWSFDVFFRELAALYTAFSTDKPSPLPKLPIQYADFADWQHQWLQGEVLESQLNYWKQQLGGSLPILQLPTNYPRPPIQTYQGKYQSLELPLDLTEALKALSQQESVTLFMTLLSAFQTLLYRYSGQQDIVIGTPIAGRNQVETEGLIGFFVNTLAIRTNLSGNQSFRQLLSQVREVTLGAIDHQDLPLEKLIEELKPERDLSRSPLFQVMFAFQNTPKQPWELPGLTITSLEVHSGTSKFDLTLALEETSEGIKGGIEYNTDLFEAATITRLLGHFQALLKGIVVKPDQRLSSLPLLTAVERHQLLVEWNDTLVDDPKDACIHQLFETQAKQTPNAVAVIVENQQITYRELNRRANQLAHYLRKQGVEPESMVGICVERSPDLLIGLLGILKAGAAYVPLDPTYPRERLSFMLSDAQVPVLLTQQPLVEKLPEHKARIVCLDTDWQVISQENQENPTSEVKPTNLAYVLYTSGSTGKPKGVAIEHRSTVSFLNWAREVFSPEQLTGVLASTSICFDLSVFELFVPLSSGGKVILAENALHLPSLKAAADVTLINTVPSAIAELLRVNGIPDSVQTVNLAGEPLSAQLVQQLYQQDRIKQVFNLYGPSEATTYSTFTLAKKETSSSPSIGRPIANTQVYILDLHLQPVPIGVAGELHIGGIGLARGYLKRPELTAEKFIPNPFSDELRARLYKTGDLARYLADGNIEFLGRIDQQVKIRGFRIELGEVEAVLVQHPAVQTAVVIDREDMPGEKRLVAYLVTDQLPAPRISELHSFLKEKLPDYMVPSAFVLLETLPLTPNGKVDRRALPVPDSSRPDLERAFVLPRNTVELQLTKVWEEVLGIQPIGVRDNFFTLGGHSLLAVRLLAQIEKVFGEHLPLTTLFQAPTVEQLASFFYQEKRSVPWSLIQVTPPNGFRPPLYWCGLGFEELAKRLGTGQPLYGLLNGFYEIQEPTTHIKTWATHYVREIRAVQPEGPYFIGGFCWAGFMAFEIAQQLQAQGKKVALLALVERDGPAPLGRLYQSTVGRFLIHQRNLKQLNPAEQLTYVLERAQRVRTWMISRFIRRPALEELASTYDSKVNALRKAQLAVQNYSSQQAYLGRVTLFFSARGKHPSFLFPKCGWGKLVTGELEIYIVPGDHLDLVQGPYVQVLAEKLRTCLDKAQADD